MITDFNSVILIIETDEDLAQRIGSDLYHAGYGSSWNSSPSKALEQLNILKPDLVLINQTLQDTSGFSLCYQMRQQGYRQAILLLMAHEDLNDRVQCLESGADDYLVKPYQSSDLIRLVHIYLKPDVPNSDQLRFSDIVLDLGTRQVFRRNRSIDLTMKEFELLKYLMEHPREVLSREQILENVWGYDFMGESNVIEVYIRYLRLKIEAEGDKRLIQTVRGVGYVLREN